MRISDWSSDVCSSDLVADRLHDDPLGTLGADLFLERLDEGKKDAALDLAPLQVADRDLVLGHGRHTLPWQCLYLRPEPQGHGALRGTLPHVDGSLGSRLAAANRSEEHTAELQSL